MCDLFPSTTVSQQKHLLEQYYLLRSKQPNKWGNLSISFAIWNTILISNNDTIYWQDECNKIINFKDKYNLASDYFHVLGNVSSNIASNYPSFSVYSVSWGIPRNSALRRLDVGLWWHGAGVFSISYIWQDLLFQDLASKPL